MVEERLEEEMAVVGEKEEVDQEEVEEEEAEEEEETDEENQEEVMMGAPPRQLLATNVSHLWRQSSPRSP